MSTIEEIRIWITGSKSNRVSSSAIIATPNDIAVLDQDTVLKQWETTLSSGCDPAPFPYVVATNMGGQVMTIAYDLTRQHPIQPEKLWVKIEHNPATPGTIQLPGGISCSPCDADPSKKQKPAQPVAPGPGQMPGGGGGGGGGGGQPVPGPGGGGAPSAPAPFPGPSGACEDGSCGGEGEPSASGGGEGEGDPSDSASGGSWGIWYGGDE